MTGPQTPHAIRSTCAGSRSSGTLSRSLPAGAERSLEKWRFAGLRALITVAGFVLTGCATGPGPAETTPPDSHAVRAGPTEAPEPCPDGTSVELGSPYRPGPQAKFSTVGGEVWITARAFEHGGIFDPETGRTGIYIGTSSEPLTDHPQSGRVGNAVLKTSVVERSWSKIHIPAGDYRLWSTSGGDVIVRSCEPEGVFDPVPVRR